MKKAGFFLIILFSTFVYSQKKDSLPLNLEDYLLVKKGDTLTIDLDEIALIPKNKFKSPKDARYYYWFRSKVYKAYPYAKLASQRLDTLNNRLTRIKSKRKRRKYTRRAQKYLEGEFTDQLKKMTKTEGRILIKLIHRQTGKTAFQNIKKLRSGWKAFWYNTSANLFKLSLKTEYHPESVNEDYLIEDILFRAFRDGNLEGQKSKLDFDFPKIASRNRGIVDVEEYKRMFSKLKSRSKRKKRKKRNNSGGSKK
ncbi:MAG: DUF4294 domain-containing protein [Flavobacteriaceae bacterium]